MDVDLSVNGILLSVDVKFKSWRLKKPENEIV